MNRWQRSRFLLYWPCWTDRQLGIMLDLSPEQVKRYRLKMGLRKRERHRWTKEQCDHIENNASTLTIKNMAEDTNASWHQVRGVLRKLDIRIDRPQDKRVREYV